MFEANFVDPQFVDANGTGGMNAAFNTVAGTFSEMGSGVWAAPGLLYPELAAFSFSGLNVQAVLNDPWGLVSSSGIVVTAHGTLTGADTQSYVTNFTSLVPATGSVTAFLAATVTQISQNSFPVPGPPPGHPSFNPSFTPTISYATDVYSVALSAVTSGIDNIHTFELFRTTLTAGQTQITAVNTAGWVRAPLRRAAPNVALNVGGNLTLPQTQYVVTPTVPGLTHTLPITSSAGGLYFQLVNPTSGNWTIATTSPDVFNGIVTTNSSKNAAIISASGAVSLWTAGSGVWTAVAASLTPTGITPGIYSGATVTVGGDGRITAIASGGYGPLAANNIWAGSNTFNNSVNVSGGLAVSGGATFTDPNTGGVNITSSTINGANLGLFGNGTVTPNKFIRANAGTLQFINSGYNTIILSVSDSGNISSPGINTWTGANTFTTTVTSNGGYSTTGLDANGFNYRMIGGSYGTGFRNDGTNTFFLLTNSGNPNGAFNGLRPIQINNATAAIIFDDTGAGVTFGGFATANARLRAIFGAYQSGDPNAAVILQDFALSAGGNGFQIFPDGFIIQWGSQLLPTQDTTTLNFPIAFPSVCFAAIAQVGTTIPAITPTASIGSQPISNSQFQVTLASPTGGSDAVWWIAVGV
jgi:hypothetical protein